MWKVITLIVATLFVASEGLYCNVCVYMETNGQPRAEDNERFGEFLFDRTCNLGSQPNPEYYPTECRPLKIDENSQNDVQPVCLTLSAEGISGKIVLRGCYHKRTAVTDDDLKTNFKNLRGFYDDTLTKDIRSYFEGDEPIMRISDGDEGSVNLCKTDICNGEARTETSTNPASIIGIFSFAMVTLIGSVVYAFN